MDLKDLEGLADEDGDRGEELSRRSFLKTLGAGFAAVLVGTSFPFNAFRDKITTVSTGLGDLPVLEDDPEKPVEGDIWLRKDLMEEV